MAAAEGTVASCSSRRDPPPHRRAARGVGRRTNDHRRPASTAGNAPDLATFLAKRLNIDYIEVLRLAPRPGQPLPVRRPAGAGEPRRGRGCGHRGPGMKGLFNERGRYGPTQRRRGGQPHRLPGHPRKDGSTRAPAAPPRRLCLPSATTSVTPRARSRRRRPAGATRSSGSPAPSLQLGPRSLTIPHASCARASRLRLPTSEIA